jgi:hypothetical protein
MVPGETTKFFPEKLLISAAELLFCGNKYLHTANGASVPLYNDELLSRIE